MTVKNVGQCIAMMASGSEVNVIRLSFMKNKGHPYSISSSMRILSCASGASMYKMGTCLLDVTIQGQTTEKLQFFTCHNKYCRIGAQAIIRRPGMKKLRLRDDPESHSIIM